MDSDNNRSSSEEISEYSSTNKTVQKMDFGEKSCSDSEEGNQRVGLAEKKPRASSSGMSRMDDQEEHFARQSKVGEVGNVSSENMRHLNQDSQTSTDQHPREDEKIEKFERNLEKFLKERKPLKEVNLRHKTETSRVVKSDGEMAKIIEYCGEMLKLSSTHSSTERSSAPPSFSNEKESKQKVQTEKLFSVDSGKKSISKGVAQTSDVLKKDTAGTETSTRALDLRLSKISAFKVPISPNNKIMPDQSTKMVSTGLNDDVQNKTPVQSRPTHFNIRPRKAFYTFSPGSSPGVLRQCQSLPEIHRPRQKDETQRRSIHFGEHSRIVRFLFKDKPEPATPESKVSKFYKSSRLVDKPQSTENTSAEAKALQNIPSKTCRKLDFGSCSKETTDKIQNATVKNMSCVAKAPKSTSPDDNQVKVRKTLQNRQYTCSKQNFSSSSKETTDKSQQTGVSSDAESPSKRKIASPVEDECSISTKKVRTSSGTKVEGSGNCENEKKNASAVGGECSVFTKKVGTSPDNRLEVDGGGGENAKQLNVGCTISVEKTKISPGTKSEGSAENVRKHESPVDVISAKKARTSLEAKIEENKSS